MSQQATDSRSGAAVAWLAAITLLTVAAWWSFTNPGWFTSIGRVYRLESLDRDFVAAKDRLGTSQPRRQLYGSLDCQPARNPLDAEGDEYQTASGKTKTVRAKACKGRGLVPRSGLRNASPTTTAR